MMCISFPKSCDLESGVESIIDGHVTTVRLEQNHLVYCDEHGDTHRCFIVDTKGTDALHTLGGDIVEGVHYTRASDGQDPSEITIIRPAALTSWLG